MLHDVPAPDISPDFTIDDIHKIREWHYEVLKDATLDEQREYYSQISLRVEAERRKMRSG